MSPSLIENFGISPALATSIIVATVTSKIILLPIKPRSHRRSRRTQSTIVVDNTASSTNSNDSKIESRRENKTLTIIEIAGLAPLIALLIPLARTLEAEGTAIAFLVTNILTLSIAPTKRGQNHSNFMDATHSHSSTPPLNTQQQGHSSDNSCSDIDSDDALNQDSYTKRTT